MFDCVSQPFLVGWGVSEDPPIPFPYGTSALSHTISPIAYELLLFNPSCPEGSSRRGGRKGLYPVGWVRGQADMGKEGVG